MADQPPGRLNQETFPSDPTTKNTVESIVGGGSVSVVNVSPRDVSTAGGLNRWWWYGEGLILAGAFALAYTQGPLFYSNQNQYLLHGLAAAGVGYLQQDWLANTRDPTPLFSHLVAVGYTYFGPVILHLAYFVLLLVYFLSFRWLVQALPFWRETLSARWGFAALFTATHAAGPRLLSVILTGTDYPWYLQCGVANQYLLGPGLQPSAFGVLLVSGLAAFAHGRFLWAGFLTGSACLFHFTYFLPVVLLVLGYVLVILADRSDQSSGGRALVLLLAVSIVCLPMAAYTLFTFGSANPQTWAEAQRILVEVRIPHHAVIDRWFAGPDTFQLVWIACGLWMVRRCVWGKALIVAALAGLLLSFVQYVSDSHLLALLFPWRISALLVPTATAIIIARLMQAIGDSPSLTYGSGILIGGLAVVGVMTMVQGWGYRMNADEEGLLVYVREHVQQGDTYLLPIRFPAVRQGRGTASTTFTPPPRPQPGSPLIPVDLQRFRLVTGAPIYVDFKSIPYYDTEVLEWYRRMKQCEEWYRGGWNTLQRREELRAEGITHVVTPASQPLFADYLRIVYQDPAYILYRIE